MSSSSSLTTTINNCVLLLLDLPQNALAGIDMLSFTTSPRFHGVRNIPPGLHFVFAANNAAFSIREGAWFHVKPIADSPQVFVKRWDKKTEELVAETEQSKVLHWKANLGSVWKDGLTPYRQTAQQDSGGEAEWVDESTDWFQLTSHITPTTLSRICGPHVDHWSLTSASSAKQDLEPIPGLKSSDGTIHAEKELGLLFINLKTTWREGVTGRERTEAARDRTWLLGQLISHLCQAKETREGESEMLGELQFTFLMVLTLNNNSCLEQWKRLLQLFLTCTQAVQLRSQLFCELLKTLRYQLGHCADAESDLFDLGEPGGGFLRPLLDKFSQNLGELEGGWKTELAKELGHLQDFVRKEFGWDAEGSYLKRGMLDLEDGERVEMEVGGVDEDEERGEYAPTVVELTPAQLEQMNGIDTRLFHESHAANTTKEAEGEMDVDGMELR